MSWYTKIDQNHMLLTLTIEDDDGEEREVDFPFEFEVCSHCNGTGSTVHPDVDSHGITSEEFSEDPEFMESYYDGNYDVSCESCNGNKVEPSLMVSLFSDEQKKWYERYNDYQEAAYECNMESDAERQALGW